MTTTKLSARLSKCGTRIVVEGYDPEVIELMHSMPDAKFHKDQKVWSCLLTPASAVRVLEASGLGIELDQSVQDAAMNHKMWLGFAAPALAEQPPIRKFDSWKHQAIGYSSCNVLPASLLNYWMGLGKSKIAVDLMVNWNCKKILVLCPTSVRAVWRREIEKWSAVKMNVIFLEKGSVKDKVVQTIKEMRFSDIPNVVVCNYESAWREPLASWLIGYGWDLVVCDEVHRLKGHDSEISKFAAKLYPASQRRLGLSGTPLAHSPLDVFGIFRFLDPGWFGTSWWHFRNRYAEMKNPHVPQMITGYRNQDELAERFHRITFTAGKECIDLPPITHTDIPVTMSAKAKKIYRNLEDNFLAEIETGVVVAGNALVKLLRLSQCTAGFLLAEDSDLIEEIDTAKEDVLEDMLADLTEPVVVFCRFRHDLQVIERVAAKLKRRYAEISGSRKDGLDSMGRMTDCDICATQISSGGVGIDLTRAAYGFYFDVGTSLAEYEQSIARLHRPCQTRHTQFFHLIVQGTVDSRAYAAFEEKREIIDAVLKGYKRHES